MKQVRHEKRRVPAGTSEYQAYWIIEDSDDGGEESRSEVGGARIDLADSALHQLASAAYMQEGEEAEFGDLLVAAIEESSSDEEKEEEGDEGSVTAPSSEMETDTVWVQKISANFTI